MAEADHLGFVVHPTLREDARTAAGTGQEADVDIRDSYPGSGLEPGGLCEKDPVLIDRGLTIPREVGRRFTLARRRVQIGRRASRRLSLAQHSPGVGFPDCDVASRQVHQNSRTSQRRDGARLYRHPHILANLSVEHEPWAVLGHEDEVGFGNRLVDISGEEEVRLSP